MLVLVVATTLAAAPARAQQPEPAPTETVAVTRARLVERIAGQLDQIADDARGIDDPKLKLSVRLQAAALLWSRDPDGAREIYADAFDALLPAASAAPEERARAAKLMPDLLSNVARHDAALAERFSARYALVPPGDDGLDAQTRAETLANAAIEMLPDDPARAATIGRLALGDQITTSFMRLLVVLRGVDAARADALFAAALGVLARNPAPRMADVQMLGFYVGANGQSQLDGVPADAMRAYLELAFRIIVMTPLDSKDASSAYFLGRQLAAAVARYLPDRASELDARLGLLSHSNGFQQATPAVDRTSDAMGDTADARRARAATAAIERDDYKTAHSEAAAIEDDDLQSRVYAQAALHLVKLRRLDEAAREIDRVPDPARRATLLIQLAHVAHSRGDIAYAVDSLSWAGREAAREPETGPRLQALFSVASAFVDVDSMRAFDAMQAAIDGVNKAVRAVDGPPVDSRAVAPASLNFDATLARLARVDFDRALSLARQFDTLGHRLLAELAVCRGGLASAGVTEVAEDLDDETASAR
jgi:hypothetical protein